MAFKGKRATRIKIEALEFEDSPEIKLGRIPPTKIEIKPSVKKKAKEEVKKTVKINEVEFKIPQESKISINIAKKMPEHKKEESKEVKVPDILYIKTLADRLLWAVQKEEKSINELSKELNASPEKIEELGLDLQEQKLVEVIYPKNVLLSPRVKAVRKIEEKTYKLSTGKEIKRYSYNSDGIPTIIRILDTGRNISTYEVIVPVIQPATEAIMNILSLKVSEDVTVTPEELSDPRMMIILKEKFMKNAIEKVNSKFTGVSDDVKKILAGFIIHKMYGLKYIELLMNDDNLEEITINGSVNPIAVYHKEIGWCITNLRVNDEEEIFNFLGSACDARIASLFIILIS